MKKGSYSASPCVALALSSIMIIYSDLISYDEMVSDIYKIVEIVDWLCLELEGKRVSRTEGNTDELFIGGNALRAKVLKAQ